MTKIYTFECVFKSTDTPVYPSSRFELERVLIVTDLSDTEATPLLDRVRTFLSVLGEAPEWRERIIDLYIA